MSLRLIIYLVVSITLVSLVFAVYQVRSENRSKRDELNRRIEKAVLDRRTVWNARLEDISETLGRAYPQAVSKDRKNVTTVSYTADGRVRVDYGFAEEGRSPSLEVHWVLGGVPGQAEFSGTVPAWSVLQLVQGLCSTVNAEQAAQSGGGLEPGGPGRG